MNRDNNDIHHNGNPGWAGIIHNFSQPVMLLDPDRRIVEANRAAREKLSVPGDGLLGEICCRLVCAGNPVQENCPFERMLASGLPETSEMEIEAMGGPFLVTCAPIHDRQGRLKRVIHLTIDITRQKKLAQEELIARKMEAVGVFAEGLAHDCNNLYSIILANIELAKSMSEDIPLRMSGNLQAAINSVLAASRLIRRLMHLADRSPDKTAPTNIAPLLFSASRNPVSDVKYIFSIPERLWPVVCNKDQIQKVISELITNSSEAMPKGGKILVGAENVEIGPWDPIFGRLQNGGKFVKILIKDEGCGIPSKHLSRIYDPYFSSKARGIRKGMGLGLSTAWVIVKSHKGHITMDSAPGAGTTVCIFLPAALPTMK